jgi:aminopeptidase
MKNKSGFDVETLADRTLEMLSVSAGQVIWIWANTCSLEFIEALALHIRRRGAFWFLRLTSDTLLKRIGLEIPEAFLSLIPMHELRWLDDIDATIEVRDHGADIPGVPLGRRRAMAAEWIALQNEAAKKNVRRVMVINPTPALAEAVGLPLDELQTRIMQAIDVDYSLVDDRQERMAGLMREANEVHMTCPSGTDLHLRLNGRNALRDTDCLPHGEAYIAPLEDSVEGVAVIEKAFLRGRQVRDLHLHFAGGRVVGLDAPDPAGAESLRELLAASTGEKDRIAEFAIGTNPGVREPTGYISLDEKIGGSAHIAIGMNDRFGGRNSSNLHLDFVIRRPTVWFDGKIILDHGEFKV